MKRVSWASPSLLALGIFVLCIEVSSIPHVFALWLKGSAGKPVIFIGRVIVYEPRSFIRL